jgi:hypothetical protein
MTDLTFIRDTMKTETSALGFIPDSTLYLRIVQPGLYLIQRDDRHRRIGYLLHGPLHAGKPLYVYQVLIQTDKRRIKHATHLLQQLRSRATLAECPEIRLRCATHLEANAFWRASGFRLDAITPGGLKRHRQIAHYSLALPDDPNAPPRTIGIPTLRSQQTIFLRL